MIGIFFLPFGISASFTLATALLKRALVLVLVVTVPQFLVSGIAEPLSPAGRGRAGPW